ncbi:MAG: DUF177 domain-containing protein [Armatimonadetes bacterium]|nr:DUF177 domain-containing protein [Armatimonadota bacterium]
MLYSILKSLREGKAVRCLVDAPAPGGTGVEVIGHVEGEVRLDPVGRTVLATGRLRALVRRPCDRCLKSHDEVLDMVVNRECCLAQADDPQAFADPGDDMPPIPILSGDEVDLSELVRQLIIVSLPPRSLCRPDCKGLCPVCGADLNEGPCHCEEQEIDPRLAPLKALLEDG